MPSRATLPSLAEGGGISQYTRVVPCVHIQSNSLSLSVAVPPLAPPRTQEEADAQRNDVMGRITASCDISSVSHCDLVIEAIIEDAAIKTEFYRNLKDVVQPGAIFASNTSSLQIGDMADVSERPDKFCSLHFFNPVQIMKLVEVVKTDKTSKDTLDRVYAFR